MCKVSIGLPVYNGAKYLEDTIKSLLNQTFNDFELIISDNASTDRTQAICTSFASRDSRVRYYQSAENRGAAWNYNNTFKLAKGEFFKWASHDDLCAPTHIEQCVKIFYRMPSVVLCYPRTIIIDGRGDVIGRFYDKLNVNFKEPHRRFKKTMLRVESGECNAVFGVIRSSVLKKTALIGNYNSSDQILLTHLALLGAFYEISQELFFRRDHSETSLKLPNEHQIAIWFDPANKRKNNVPVWTRKFYEYIKVVICTHCVGLITRLYCLMPILRWGWWQKSKIIHEIGLLTRQTLLNRK